MSGLHSVSVPAPFEAIFRRAEEYVRRYFADRIEDPQHSTISISGERYILVRAASMSVEFFDLVTKLYEDRGLDEARTVANNLLFDVAHAIGKADARAFHQRMGVSDPIERLSAGPIHFSYSGWAFVKIDPTSHPSADEHYFLLYDHPFSFESDAWIRRGRRVDYPVCIMNAGYSSGWCEESFGLPLVAAEVECLAKGDSACRFIMAPPRQIEQHLARYFQKREPRTPRGEPQVPRANAPVEVPEFFQRKRMEEDLRESRDQLEQRVLERTTELQHAVSALQHEIQERSRTEDERRRLEGQLQHAQKLESLGLLAGGIAHDFNNLLVGVLGNASLALLELPPDARARQTIQDIETAALRAADLTRQMLAYSGRGAFVVERADLSRIVEEIAQLLTTVISKKATLNIHLSQQLPAVEADVTQLRQVVMNLITNASDALGDGAGEITLATGVMHADRGYLHQTYLDEQQVEGPYVFLSVTDTGRGMDAATRARIFDPFFSTKFTGRGLGLAAVLGIVRAHQGAIRVESVPEAGSTFTLLLPMAGESIPASIRPAPVATSQVGSAAAAGGRTVLVVDDEPAVRNVARKILQRVGFTVLLANDGREAVEVFRREVGSISLVVLDMTMPELNGAETFHAIRAIRPDVRVVLTSGYSERELSSQFPTARPARFLPKPFTADLLLACVQEALAGGGESSADSVAS